LGFKSSGFPEIGTATEWHDGQFAHDTHAPISLGLSGKSVPTPMTAPHRSGCALAQSGLKSNLEKVVQHG